MGGVSDVLPEYRGDGDFIRLARAHYGDTLFQDVRDRSDFTVEIASRHFRIVFYEHHFGTFLQCENPVYGKSIVRKLPFYHRMERMSSCVDLFQFGIVDGIGAEIVRGERDVILFGQRVKVRVVTALQELEPFS